MNNKSKGRGKRIQNELSEPDKNAVDKLNQERASIAGNKESEVSPDQVADSPDEEAPESGAATTIGEGKEPPAISDLKEALQDLHVGKEVSASTSIIIQKKSGKKLNPSVPAFQPSAPVPSSNQSALMGSSSLLYTKHSPSQGNQQLNPESKEFVPSGLPVNVLASNGNTNFFENGDLGPEEEDGRGLFDVPDIVEGFERAAPTDNGDHNMDAILKGGAEMLLKVWYYPGSFDEIGNKFQQSLKEPMTQNEQINLAEMLGIMDVNLRYAACRVSSLIYEAKNAEGFKTVLMERLSAWNKKCSARSTEEENSVFVSFCGFLAEIFAKLRVGDKPVNILGIVLFSHIETLLNMEDLFIREACNILKLTGSSLLNIEGYDIKMEAIIKKLNELLVNNALSETCRHLLLQVIELTGSQWSFNSTGPMTEKFNFNTEAKPFIPSTEYSIPSETFYPVVQQPVSNAEEWSEFVGDDEAGDVYDPSSVPAPGDEDDYEGLDPDIELEMEAFIDEIEEHLMLQDFDPDLH